MFLSDELMVRVSLKQLPIVFQRATAVMKSGSPLRSFLYAFEATYFHRDCDGSVQVSQVLPQSRCLHGDSPFDDYAQILEVDIGDEFGRRLCSEVI